MDGSEIQTPDYFPHTLLKGHTYTFSFSNLPYQSNLSGDYGGIVLYVGVEDKNVTATIQGKLYNYNDSTAIWQGTQTLTANWWATTAEGLPVYPIDFNATGGFRTVGFVPTWTGNRGSAELIIQGNDVNVSRVVFLNRTGGSQYLLDARAHYSLSVFTDQTKGTIGLSPLQSSYIWGDVVTATASPLPGYVFAKWSGATQSTENIVALTMNNDKTITAEYTQDNRDNDADGLSNYQESITYGSNPNAKDSNGDGVEDGQAVSMGYSPTLNFSALIAHPPTGLYTTSQIQNMAISDLVLTKNANGSFTLNYDIEKSEDLQSWTTYAPLSLTLTNLPPDKAFIRIKPKQ